MMRSRSMLFKPLSKDRSRAEYGHHGYGWRLGLPPTPSHICMRSLQEAFGKSGMSSNDRVASAYNGGSER